MGDPLYPWDRKQESQQDERETRTLADWLKLAPATWDSEYANLWAQLQVAQERVMEYRARWKGAQQVQADAGAVAEADDLLRACHRWHAGDSHTKKRIENVRVALATHPSPAAESDKRDAMSEDMRLDLAAISEAIAHGDHTKAQTLIREILTTGFTDNKSPDIAMADDIRMVVESVDYWVLNQQVYVDHRSDLDEALKRLRAAMSREQSGGDRG